MERVVDTGSGTDQNENSLTCPSIAPAWFELLIFKRPTGAPRGRWVHSQVTTIPISNNSYERDFRSDARTLIHLRHLPTEALAQLERVLHEKNVVLRKYGWAWIADWLDMEKEGPGGYSGEFALGIRRVRIHDCGEGDEEQWVEEESVRRIGRTESAMLCN
jgi:hypothetical protein